MSNSAPSPDTVRQALELSSAPSSLPQGVTGKMDGEKPPMTQVEEIKKALEPMQKKYGHYLSNMKPWREFLYVTKPQGDIQQRLNANLTYFQINYAIVFLMLMVVSIVMNPHCVVVISVLTLVWSAFLKKNDDPDWQVIVGGLKLEKTHRWMVLTAITAIVFLSAVGQVLSSAAFFCAVLVILHGVLHPIPELPAEEGDEDMV